MIIERNLLKISEERWVELARQAGYQVGALARLAGCSAKQLGRFFKKHKGIGTREWMTLLRIRTAAEALKQKMVKEAAAEAGYAAPSQFCRAFKACYGLRPGQAAMGALDSAEKRQTAEERSRLITNPPIH